MAVCKLWQTPMAHFDRPLPANHEPGSTHFLGPLKLRPRTLWFNLWDPTDQRFERTGKATFIAFQKINAAFDRRRLPVHEDHQDSTADVFEELGPLSFTGNEIDTYMWPWVYTKGWEKYKKIEASRIVNKLHLLYYLVYHEEFLDSITPWHKMQDLPFVRLMNKVNGADSAYECITYVGQKADNQTHVTTLTLS